MKTLHITKRPRLDGLMMVECLVYIGVLFTLLGAGYVAMYRCIDSSVALRRNANDITSALRTGERWRADIRAASGPIRVENTSGGQVIRMPAARGEVDYRWTANSIERRLGSGTWITLLDNVQVSSFAAVPGKSVTAWKWELELQPYTKGSVKPGRIRPLFTFLAVPGGSSK